VTEFPFAVESEVVELYSCGPPQDCQVPLEKITDGSLSSTIVVVDAISLLKGGIEENTRGTVAQR